MLPIRVGIADDHHIVRIGIRHLVRQQADMEFVGEARDGRGAIDLVRAHPLDVLILDLLMPGQGGLDCLAMLRAKAPDLRFLVFTTCHEGLYASTVFRRGAHGYLGKQCEPDEILHAVRMLAAGRRYVSPEAAEAMAEELNPAQPAHLHESLTEREFQLLLQLARGSGSHQIALDLALSPKTVSTYRSVLLHKLGLRNDSELTRYAVSHGLLD